MDSQAQSKSAWMAYLPQIVIAGATVVGAIILYGFLRSIGVIDSGKEDRDADELAGDISLSENTVNAINQVDNQFRAAIKAAVIKKYGYKATPENVKAFTESLLPGKKNFGKFADEIISSYNRLSTNDAGKIMGVFKNLKSQFEVNAFATFYYAYTTSPTVKANLPKSSLGGDLYSVLDNLMFDSDMSKLRDLINKKPII